MSFENPTDQPSDNRSTEILGKQYEVVDINILNPDLIEQNDRAFITTKSGNRYMVRRSKSRGGALTVYNEREGFSVGLPLHNQNETITRITEPMKLWVVTDEEKQLGKEIKSTEITAIEIRKGVDDILNSTPDELKAKNLSDRLKKPNNG
jgi:hypothetical protein